MSSLPARTLRLERFSRSARQLSYTASVGDLAFTTSFWYQVVDLPELEARYGAAFMRRVYLHAIAFDLNRLVSLAPEHVHFGPLADVVDEAFFRYWTRVTHGVWSQWRYENDRPDYTGPALAHDPAESAEAAASITLDAGDVRSLAFCGGGKDSLLAMKILEEVDEPFATLGYSHSIYGRAEPQHGLIERLVRHGAGRRHHRLWMYDDLMDSPVLEVEPWLGVRTLTAGETPASLFAALPIALAHGYLHLVLAHEKSADVGNLVWEETGEEINHQWGKSLEAERLLRDYVRSRLVRNLEYFSILKPLQDAVIFPSLGRHLEAVPDTHSCNVDKPWCGRCPKCAYVWLNYLAYLPTELVDGMFGENLFHLPENQLTFRQLLGLEAHTPFECVGQVEESRLAFELCRRKGLTGGAMKTYERELGVTGDRAPGDPGLPAWDEIAGLYDVAGAADCIPAPLREAVVGVLERLAGDAARDVKRRLGS